MEGEMNNLKQRQAGPFLFAAWCKRQSELSRLRWEAEQLCVALCQLLTWKHDAERTMRLTRALIRARERAARRESLV
jgi:hypothetical protein